MKPSDRPRTSNVPDLHRDTRSVISGLAIAIQIYLLIALCVPFLGHAVSIGALSSNVPTGPTTEKSVLLIDSFTDPNIEASPVLESELRTHSPWPINFYVERMEGRRLDDADYENGLLKSLSHTYGRRKLDLVIVNFYPALRFALTHREDLFPGVPIVFLGINVARLEGQKIWPGVTGVSLIVDVRETIDLVLRIHPDTNTVAIVTENSTFEKFYLAAAHAELVRHQDKVKEVDLVGLPTDQLFESVAALPPQTIVLYQEGPQASVHPAMGTYGVLGWIGQHLPTYCIWPETCLNHGGIGGAAYDLDRQASLAAEVARRVLSGEPPEHIPVVNDPTHMFAVDWRELRRWRISESALPLGTIIVNREPGLWERGRKYFVAGIAVILVQAVLIFGLLWQRARKRKAEAVLRESEERFRVMADTTPSLIWMCDAHGKVTYLNDQWIAFSGSDANAGYGDAWTGYVHPDDVQRVLEALWQAVKDRRPFSKEYRLRRSDGVYRWMFDVASPRINGDGSLAGFIGSAIDVTDQKLAQQALEKVSGQLIEAQEKERSRIARELHDDICQRLALLSMELEQAKRVRIDSVAATRVNLEEIRRHCAEITDDVQSLSHHLHSSRLDFLGIVAAVQGFCREFSKKHGVNVEFSEKDVPEKISNEVSLGLFRIAQEALHNSVKYSGAKEFKVELCHIADAIQLTVTDAGSGFNVEEARRKGGLGLLSMQERIHLIHGKLTVESVPGLGTKVIATAPVVIQESSAEERAVKISSPNNH